MQISGDNSRRIDYSEGREIHSGWAQECEEETVANLRWAQLCRALRVRLLRNYQCRNIGIIIGLAAFNLYGPLTDDVRTEKGIASKQYAV